jgi:hypothetical protein
MFASAVRSPVPVTSTRSEPAPLTVPAITFAPCVFSTGTDSPVIIDSLTSLLPVRTIPSAGMLAPGRTSTKSPPVSAEIGTSSMRSPTIFCAVLTATPRTLVLTCPLGVAIEVHAYCVTY